MSSEAPRKRIAVCPGSFDPITKGHIDIIERAAKIFDKVIVLVSFNPNKSGSESFTIEERMMLILKVTKHLENVLVDCHHGLLAEYLEPTHACAIVKGLRAVSDFEYEFQMALLNKALNSEYETVFMMTDSKFSYISSSMVKDVAKYHGELEGLVPLCIAERIREKYAK